MSWLSNLFSLGKKQPSPPPAPQLQLPVDEFILPLGPRIEQAGERACVACDLRMILDSAVLARKFTPPADPTWEEIWRGAKGNDFRNQAIHPMQALIWLRNRGVIEAGLWLAVPAPGEPDWMDGKRALVAMYVDRVPVLMWVSWVDGLRIPSGPMVTTPLGQVRVANWEGYAGSVGQHTVMLFGWCPTPEVGRVMLCMSSENARLFALKEAEFGRLCNVTDPRYAAHLYTLRPRREWYAPAAPLPPSTITA